MTTTAAAEATPHLRALAQRQAEINAAGPDWLRALRADAMDAFTRLGFPTARRGNEEWKYTDVGPIARAQFPPVQPAPAPEADAAALAPYTDPSWHRLVFLDGALSPALSHTNGLPPGVLVTGLAEALESRPELIGKTLGRHASYDEHGFTALNTAYLGQGAAVIVPRDTAVEAPIQLLHLTTRHGAGAMVQPRTLVIAERGSRAAVVESYGSVFDGPYLCNAVTEVVLGPNASVEHYRVQAHGAGAFHVGTCQAVLGEDSRYSSMTLDRGGALVRNNLNALVNGPGAHAALNGLYMAGGSQIIDNQVVIDHAAPHTSSRELYKGILGGRSRAAFHGSITVRKDAQKVDAHQEDKNLLLSDKAQVNVKPAFWIYADDVRCGHGAASGQIDESSIFYLRSRGLDRAEAHAMLVRGFANQVIERSACPSVRDHVSNLVEAVLPGL